MKTTDEVKRVLVACDLRRANSVAVADYLNISTSTLRRKLRSEGSSFQKLLDEERVYRCYLRISENPRLLSKQIYNELGYATPNSFCRSFKRNWGVDFQKYKISIRARLLE